MPKEKTSRLSFHWNEITPQKCSAIVKLERWEKSDLIAFSPRISRTFKVEVSNTLFHLSFNPPDDTIPKLTRKEREIIKEKASSVFMVASASNKDYTWINV